MPNWKVRQRTARPRRGQACGRRCTGEQNRIGVHDLRHLAATLPIAVGVPLVTVSKTLRHSTLSTTANVYDHLPRQAAAEAVNTIAAVLAQADRDAARFH